MAPAIYGTDAQLHRWIANRISEILGNEDDVVIELCFNLIDGPRYVRLFVVSVESTLPSGRANWLDLDISPTSNRYRYNLPDS